MKSCCIILLLLLLSGGENLLRGQQIYIQRYTIEDGLVNNDILNIYQDSRGFIWICTRGGLSRYDGSRFVNFTTSNGLTNDMINDIIEIAPQEFIVAQNSTGPRLLKNERIGPLPVKSDIIINKFYPVGSGRLLAATDFNGIMQWNNGKLTRLNNDFSGSISRMAMLNDSVWLTIDINLYAQFTSPSLQRKSSLLPVGATTTFTDSKRRIWLGTAYGLKLFDPASRVGESIQYLPLPPEFDLPILRQSYITDIVEDRRGNFWMGTVNGLVRIDKNGIFRIYTQLDGLPSPFVNCIREDLQHNIWVGTQLGLARLALNNEVNSYNLNLGFTYEGLFILDPAHGKHLRIFHGKKVSDLDLVSGKVTTGPEYNTAVYSINKLNERELLLGNGPKGMIYHSGQSEPELIDWPGQQFTAVVRRDRDNFIAARHDTLFVINGGRYTPALKTGTVASVYQLAMIEKNVLWVGTWHQGLIKIHVSEEQGTIILKVADRITGLLPDSNVRALYADKPNEVWVGTRYQGLIRVLVKDNGQYDMQQYGTRQGLASDFVLSMARDPGGNLWVGSSQGLDKLIPSSDRYRIFNFGKLNKVFSKIYDIRFLDSNYIVATAQNSMVYTKDLQQDKIPPQPVYITKISATPADSLSVSLSAGTQLPYDKAQVYFEFSTPQFINEAFTKYSYRLLGGNDTAWNIAGKSRSVYFANLRPGNYTFQVRALGLNDQWGQPAVYHFNVQSPYWQKAWFIVLVVLAVGLLIYSSYRYRVQQLVRLERVRNRIATDLHDEIGSNLTNISILSNLSKKNLLQPQKAGDFLERISEEVSSSSQALDDIIWSVDAGHDTLAETVARMRRYAAELFDSANISYELDLDTVFEEKRLDMEQRRDIYLLYKEAVNNISKHAGAQHVHIRIAIEHHQLLLLVKDDGQGFDPLRETSRHGLKGMRQRVSKWEGSMIVESGSGKGASIAIRLPVSR